MNTTTNTTKPTPPNAAPSNTAPKTDAVKMADKSGAACSTDKNKDSSACSTNKSDAKKTAA